MADQKTKLTTRIILNAIFPVMKVVVSDDLKINKRFQGVDARVQFVAHDNGEQHGASLVFTKGELSICQGIADSADITFSFSSLKKFNDFLAGKTVLPKISGFMKFGLLTKIISLLLAMKLMMPNARPKAFDKKRLKVKMIIW